MDEDRVQGSPHTTNTHRLRITNLPVSFAQQAPGSGDTLVYYIQTLLDVTVLHYDAQPH
ncbi:MAG: hypothetical protein ACKPKO_31425 [Candidatus Fonsibacter sp.]